MVDSLYVKANGEMPCWDDVGEERILRRLDPESLAAGREADLVGTPELVELDAPISTDAFHFRACASAAPSSATAGPATSARSGSRCCTSSRRTCAT